MYIARLFLLFFSSLLALSAAAAVLTCPATGSWPATAVGSNYTLPCNSSAIGIGEFRSCSLVNNVTTWSSILNLCIANTNPSSCYCSPTVGWKYSAFRNLTDVTVNSACSGVDYSTNDTNGQPKNRYLQRICQLTAPNTCSWGNLTNTCCSCPTDSGFPETEPGITASISCPFSDNINATQQRTCNVNTNTGVCSWSAISNTCNLVTTTCNCPAVDGFNATVGANTTIAPCGSLETGIGRMRTCNLNATTNTCTWGNISNYCAASTCNCSADSGWPSTQGGLAATLPCSSGSNDQFRFRLCTWTNQTSGYAGFCSWNDPINNCNQYHVFPTNANGTSGILAKRSFFDYTFETPESDHAPAKGWTPKYTEPRFEVQYVGGESAPKQSRSANHTLHVRDGCSSTSPCADGSCCSQYGYCGYTSDFCGAGCQSNCNAKPPTTDCGQYGVTTECPLDVCCSQWGYCGTTSDFCGTGCQSNCGWMNPPSPTCGGSINSLRVGYYASWSATRACHQFFPEDIDAERYTHLLYSAAVVTAGFQIAPGTEGTGLYRRFTGLKQNNPALKVGISVGGWDFNDPPTQTRFSDMVATSSSRATFISSVIQFLEEYGFDGIDLDWEYPAASDRGGVPADTPNYTSLLQEMRAAFGTRYFLTVAAPAAYWYLQNFEVDKMAQSVDWINMMTYDFHGTWDQFVADLGPYVRAATSIIDLETAINLFTKAGAPSNKLVLGLAFYGRAYTLSNPSCNTIGCEFSGPAAPGVCTQAAGSLAYFEIVDIIQQQGITPYYNTTDDTVYMTYSGDQWVSFDNQESINKKQAFATSNCLLGYMMWSVDMDDGLMQSTTPARNCPQDGAWPSLAAGKTYTNPCPATTSGSTSRTCGSDGTWGSVQGSCPIPNWANNKALSTTGSTYTPGLQNNCFKHSHGRGAGVPLSSCPSGSERNGALCYPNCKAGYSGNGPVCWQICPSGYSDQGALCYLGADIFSSNNGKCPWYDKCGLTFAKGCSTCPSGYINDGCTCRRNPDIFAKKSYGRGAGTPMICAAGQEQNGALCYPPCESGYYGVGPVCWQSCPANQVNCGVMCADSAGYCALGILTPFVEVGTLLGFLALLALNPALIAVLAGWGISEVTAIILGSGLVATSIGGNFYLNGMC